MADFGVLILAMAIATFAGVVKGTVGFAMPMVMISGLASFLPAEQALAALILPTLVTNLAQALRNGLAEALASTRRYWRLIVPLCLCVVLSAQLVPLVSQHALLLTLGLPITAFALTQLAGWQWRFRTENRARAEIATGILAGLWGGMSGVWGPPTVAFLLSLEIDKRENLRVQGVIYLIGAVALCVGHAGSGVLNAQSLGFSALLVLPASIGLWLGFRLHDRLDPVRFRRGTLIVLTLSGFNLIRRAIALD